MTHKAINIDPETLGGTPVFTGTRVPIQALFDYLESGETLDEFLENFPTVKKGQALEVLKIAEKLVTREKILNKKFVYLMFLFLGLTGSLYSQDVVEREQSAQKGSFGVTSTNNPYLNLNYSRYFSYTKNFLTLGNFKLFSAYFFNPTIYEQYYDHILLGDFNLREKGFNNNQFLNPYNSVNISSTISSGLNQLLINQTYQLYQKTKK